ncbi:MAG: right-handed parallel beta-helix repeat-containing protein [Acidobacteria bacterium]|nr:right-handed parallel beta-helix repeat-containing protein [Acidobacteriota bacterium]
MPIDGTDCSQLINDAISNVVANGGGTVIIPWRNTGGNMCVYRVDTQANTDGSAYWGILLQSNVRLQFKPGVKLQALPNDSSKLWERSYIVYGKQVHDVEICNGWFVGERYTHIYSTRKTKTDEWWHGMQLLGVSAMTIRGTQISDCTGDGICVGNIGGVGTSDLVLCDVVSTGNRRQALSITQGDNISVYDSEFSYTSGTAPMDGIDIEPQGSAHVNNLTIDNCIIKGNAGDGIQINARGTNVTNVNITNCLISYNYYGGFVAQSGKVNNIAGIIDTGTVYGNAFYQNGYYGLSLSGSTANYIVGGKHSYSEYSNSFADNDNLYTDIEYPNTKEANTQGYVSGTDMNLSSTAQTVNTIGWNSYFTPADPLSSESHGCHESPFHWPDHDDHGNDNHGHEDHSPHGGGH